MSRANGAGKAGTVRGAGKRGKPIVVSDSESDSVYDGDDDMDEVDELQSRFINEVLHAAPRLSAARRRAPAPQVETEMRRGIASEVLPPANLPPPVSSSSSSLPLPPPPSQGSARLWLLIPVLLIVLAFGFMSSTNSAALTNFSSPSPSPSSSASSISTPVTDSPLSPSSTTAAPTPSPTPTAPPPPPPTAPPPPPVITVFDRVNASVHELARRHPWFAHALLSPSAPTSLRYALVEQLQRAAAAASSTSAADGGSGSTAHSDAADAWPRALVVTLAAPAGAIETRVFAEDLVRSLASLLEHRRAPLTVRANSPVVSSAPMLKAAIQQHLGDVKLVGKGGAASSAVPSGAAAIWLQPPLNSAAFPFSAAHALWSVTDEQRPPYSTSAIVLLVDYASLDVPGTEWMWQCDCGDMALGGTLATQCADSHSFARVSVSIAPLHTHSHAQSLFYAPGGAAPLAADAGAREAAAHASDLAAIAASTAARVANVKRDVGAALQRVWLRQIDDAIQRLQQAGSGAGGGGGGRDVSEITHLRVASEDLVPALRARLVQHVLYVNHASQV